MADTGASKGTGLAPNIASLVCYICPPATSIVIMLLERNNKDVQFHAWQATTLSVGYIVVLIALNIVVVLVSKIAGFLGVVVSWLEPLLNLAVFILWLVCLVKAYQGERWKIPYVGDFAERRAGAA